MSFLPASAHLSNCETALAASWERLVRESFGLTAGTKQPKEYEVGDLALENSAPTLRQLVH